MGEFFKSMRRKIGVATLVMACLFMAIWIKSTNTKKPPFAPSTPFEADLIDFNYLLSIQRKENSFAGFGTYGNTLSLMINKKKNFKFQTCLGSPTEDELEDDGKSTSANDGLLGLGTIRTITSLTPTSVVSISVVWVVIPITALSAYLLLQKPRQSTQKKIAEPVQDDRGGAAS